MTFGKGAGLAALVLITVLIAGSAGWFRGGAAEPPVRGDLDRRAARRAGATDNNSTQDGDSEVLVLRMANLERRTGTYRPGRDPFRFAPKVVQQKPPPPVQKPKPTSVARKPSPPAERNPQPPSIQFKYLGSFGPDWGRIAVFVDGQEIINATVGQVLQDKFVVAEIGYESVDIGFVGFPAEPAKRLAVGG